MTELQHRSCSPISFNCFSISLYCFYISLCCFYISIVVAVLFLIVVSLFQVCCFNYFKFSKYECVGVSHTGGTHHFHYWVVVMGYPRDCCFLFIPTREKRIARDGVKLFNNYTRPWMYSHADEDYKVVETGNIGTD